MLRAVDAAFFMDGKPMPWRIWKAGQSCARPSACFALPVQKLQIGGESVLLEQVMAEMMAALRTQLLEHSNLGAEADDKVEAMLGLPANANSKRCARAHLSAGA
jgi:hypothetical protein